MHTFVFNWFKYNRYNKVFPRANRVSANTLVGAIDIFQRSLGTPKEICITAIHEVDSSGNSISNEVFKVNPADFSVIKEDK